jgi:hypothetical protein
MTEEAEKQPVEEGKIHARPPAHRAVVAADPQMDENLDRALNETFPASDPVSISPGAD